jgi:hypothetical protein
MLKETPFSVYDFLGYMIPGALLLCIAMKYPAFGWSTWDKSFLSGETIKFVLYSYVLGHLLSLISSFTIEKHSIWRFGYPSHLLLGKQPPKYLHVTRSRIQRVGVRILVWLSIAPVSVLDWLLGTVLGFAELYARPLDPFLIGVISEQLKKLPARLDVTWNHVNEADLFLPGYHFAVERAPAHFPKDARRNNLITA